MKNEMPDSMLDAMLDEIRAGEPDTNVVEEARVRGWERLKAAATAASGERIESCAGFQALFGEYRANTLTPARRMLVEDHLHECVACRRKLHELTSPKVVEMKPAPTPRRQVGAPKWAIAAMLVVGVGVGAWSTREWFGPAPSGPRVRVLSADGGVYRLDGGSLKPVSLGAELSEGVPLRTAGGGHASVRLIDGSTVEVGERAEFSVSASRRDTTVNLQRGQIIVQAAKRSSGHLYVSTGDSRVAVTGTIFSVNRGVAGARVSVVEGEVHVEHGAQKDVLHAGDQVATHPSIERTSVQDDIAWSRNIDQYLDLLKQFAAIRNKLSQVQMPGLRYGSKLIDSAPAGTLVYVSLPNLSNAIRDLQRIIADQQRQSPVLTEWMQKQMPMFEDITTRLTRFGDYVGDEVVLAVEPSCKGFCGVVIAEVNRPGLKEYVESELAKAGAPPEHLKVEYSGNKVFIGPAERVADAIHAHGFAQTPLGQTVSTVYSRGAGLFVAADVQQLSNGHAPANVRHLVAEQKTANGKSEYSAVLSFTGQREGIASWLAAPGTVGGLDFVSPGAQFAAAFVVKQPTQMLQDAIAMAGGNKPDLSEFEQHFGISLQQLAGYLGGEVTVAVDGPLVPLPSWKLAADVRDPAGLQAALEKMGAAHGISIDKQTVNGRVFYAIKLPMEKMPVEIHYTYVDGYLLAGSNNTLLQRALRDRAAGVTLAKSQDFRNLLPRERRTSFSGLVYQNAGDVLQLLGEAAGGSNSKLTPEQQKAADELAQQMKATVICLYGDADRIEIASQIEPTNLLLKGLSAKLFAGITPGSPKELPRTLHRR